MTELLVEGYYLHFGLPYCLHYMSEQFKKKYPRFYGELQRYWRQ